MDTQDELRRKAQQLNQEGNEYLDKARDKFAEAADTLGAMGPIVEGYQKPPTTLPPPPVILNPSPDQITFVTKQITDNAILGKIRAHGYSKRQAWNADESLIHMPGGDFKIVDNTGAVQFPAPVSSEYNWHPVDPNLMYGTRSDSKFGLANVTNGSFISLFEHGAGGLKLGSGEGNLDDAGRYAPLDTALEFLVFDIREAKVVARLPKEAHYNWHSMSHTGEFVVVGNASFDHPDLGRNKKVYDRELNHLHTIHGSEHGDFVLIDGEDWYVELGRRPKATKLSSGYVMWLGPDKSWTWGHFSGRGPEGKIFYSVHEGLHEGWSNYSIGEFDVKKGLASNLQWDVIDHSGSQEYVNQMKLSVSPSGKRVIYTSDETGIAEDYVVERLSS